MRFVLLLLAVLCLAVPALASPDALDIRPPILKHEDKSGAIGKRMYYLLQRQLGADIREQLRFGSDSPLPERFVNATDGAQYHEREIRPIVSLISSGAIILRFGNFDERTAGISRAHSERIIVDLIPVFAAHHTVNNPDKKSWWWGNEWQSAFWAGELARGAWLLHDRLSPETRQNVAKVIAYEADRFLQGPAPHNEFLDTKAEENAWNSQALALAACMLPNHPHRDAWDYKAREYMVTAFAAPQDLGSDRVVDGKPLKDWLLGANVHRDYTLENHNIFHLDYETTYGLNVENAVAYGLAGLPVPQAALFNADKCREIAKLFTLPTGCMAYPMSTDWSLYRNDVTVQAQDPGGLMPDPIGLRCLTWTLDSLQRADNPGPPHSLFGFNYECTPLHVFSKAYLIYRLYGAGGEPASEEDTLRRLSGTKLLPNGRVVVCRSTQGIASFSWFNTGGQLCGVVMPMSDAYATVSGPRSLIGRIGDKLDPIRIASREIGSLSGGGFSVGLALERGPEYGVKERVMMLALPDGRVVYNEWFDPASAFTGPMSTGLLYVEDKPFWLRDDTLRIAHPGGVWAGDPSALVLEGEKTPWLNVANRLGIVLRGAKKITYSARQLALNYVPAGDRPSDCMTAIFYPNTDRQATARANDLVGVSSQGDALLVNLGDVRVILNPTDEPVEVTLSGKSLTLHPLHGVVESPALAAVSGQP